MPRGDGLRRSGVKPQATSGRLLAHMLTKQPGVRVLAVDLQERLGIDSHRLSQSARELVAIGVLGIENPGRGRKLVWLIDKAQGEAVLERGRQPPRGRRSEAGMSAERARRAAVLDELSQAITGGLIARLRAMHTTWAGPARPLSKAGLMDPVEPLEDEGAEA